LTDKAWKSFERRLARYIGNAERVPITGRQRGSAPDVKHAWLSIEAKYRKKLPDWIHDAMSQAKASAVGHQMPVVIMGEKGAETGRAWIMCELEDFRDRFL
jgi:hypothetical protein